MTILDQSMDYGRGETSPSPFIGETEGVSGGQLKSVLEGSSIHE